MSSPVPPDEGLPQRLRALAFLRQGEDRIGRAWFRSLTRFLDRVRPQALPPGGGINPGAVSSNAGFWTDEVNVSVVPTIRSVLVDAWARVRREPPGVDPWVANYLNDAGNRLVRVPDEVYALIVQEIEAGRRENEGIPDITARVQRVLTSTASEFWPNRARTVARTETMGSVNAGIFRSAVLEAEERGDLAPFKAWLATDDTRTRPTHVEADGQRTLLTAPFIVGGASLMFPGDPRGPAGEVINCRCVTLPFILGEQIDWTDRQQP